MNNNGQDSISPGDFAYVQELVRRRSAIVLEEGKECLVEARLAPLARQQGLSSITDLIERARGESAGPLQRQVVEALATNETLFFRDMAPFEAMRNVLVPELMKKRFDERRLTIWSGACSTGQEPYSVAMMMREHFHQPAWSFKIWATDLSEEVLTRARVGRFTHLEINRGLPASYLVKYFTQEPAARWRINDDIQNMVTFDRVNLAEPWPLLPPADLVLLRNVLIYFDVETKKAILERVRKVLRPDGYLLLGGAETTLHLDDRFKPLQIEKCICYQQKV